MPRFCGHDTVLTPGEPYEACHVCWLYFNDTAMRSYMDKGVLTVLSTSPLEMPDKSQSEDFPSLLQQAVNFGRPEVLRINLDVPMPIQIKVSKRLV